jgi:hypothetical protein
MSARTGLMAMIGRELVEHSAVRAEPAWETLADRAVEAPNDPRQVIEVRLS